MKKVTTALREVIKEVCPNYLINTVYSDSRKRKTAVGIKICGKEMKHEELKSISQKMHKRGYEEIGIWYNQNPQRPYGGFFDGTRFTYYKPN